MLLVAADALLLAVIGVKTGKKHVAEEVFCGVLAVTSSTASGGDLRGCRSAELGFKRSSIISIGN